MARFDVHLALVAWSWEDVGAPHLARYVFCGPSFRCAPRPTRTRVPAPRI